MVVWFRGAQHAAKWLRKRWSGGRTNGMAVAPMGRVVNAVGGGGFGIRTKRARMGRRERGAVRATFGSCGYAAAG
jgi:hypothetical protein